MSTKDTKSDEEWLREVSKRDHAHVFDSIRLARTDGEIPRTEHSDGKMPDPEAARDAMIERSRNRTPGGERARKLDDPRANDAPATADEAWHRMVERNQNRWKK